MEKLLRHNFKQRYVVFDTETEGLNLIKSRTWQLSWLVGVGNKVESVHDHYLAWEDLNVSPDAARITGFTKKEYIRRREDPYHIFPKFWADIDRPDTIVVGHNPLAFDIFMVNIIRRDLGLASNYDFVKRILDTKALSMAVLMNLKPPVDVDMLEWQYKLTNLIKRGVKTNMAAMLKHYGIDFDHARLHDGKYDMEKNFELMHEIIRDLEVPEWIAA